MPCKCKRPKRVVIKRSRFVPGKFAAWTPWFGTIVIRPHAWFVARSASFRLQDLAHELQHLIQWERHGLAFPFLYAWQWVVAKREHIQIPFEFEARLAEGDGAMLSWAQEYAHVLQD